MSTTKTPFFSDVSCQKIRGGKHTLWQAKKPGQYLVGAGNTAENAILDLQRQIRYCSK